MTAGAASAPAALAKTAPAAPLPAWGPLAAAFLLALAVASLDPTVYIGGGYDDWHYLEAARCVAAHGLCLARDHWQSRLPLILPVGGAIALFGEGKAALGLVPALYAAAALALFVTLVQRQFGRAEALIAGLALAATPVIGRDFMRLSVDLAELALLLAALACLQRRAQGGRAGWAAAAGLALALAIESRATSLVALPAFTALLALPAFGRRDRLAFAAALLAPFVVQAAADFSAAGDALHHWRLQLGHTRLASSELPRGAAASGSPLFNVAIISAWTPAAGVHVHWTLDALLNLLVHPETGSTLVAASLLLALNARRLGERELRPLLWILAAAALWFGGLVFGLAVDPKPRMFEPVLAAAAAAAGLLAARHWRAGERLVPVACLAFLSLWGLVRAYDEFDRAPVAAAAGQWARRDARGLAVEAATARFLALDEAASRLPVHPGTAARRLLFVGAGACRTAAHGAGLSEWRVAREERFERRDPAPFAALRARGLLLYPQEPPVVCLLER